MQLAGTLDSTRSMELTWGEDFDTLADVAGSVFTAYSPLEDRANDVPFADQIAQFAELGWLSLGDPTAAEADSPSLGTIAAIFVEMGRALAPTPLLELMVARDAALLAGGEAANALATRIGDGAAVVVPAFSGDDWESTLAYRDGALTGAVHAVDHADRAEHLLVYATGDESVLALVDRAAVALEAMPNIGDQPLFSVVFDGVAPAASAVLARGADADRVVEAARQRADVLRAAQVYGAGLRLLDITVRYAQQRHQFGGPIGRFQAVQYLCTDIAIAAQLTSVHVRSVIDAIEAGTSAQPYIGLLRKQAAKASLEMVHSAHEVHAGIGYMVESDVHLFTNAAKRWQYDFGSASRNDSAIVAALDRVYTGE